MGRNYAILEDALNIYGDMMGDNGTTISGLSARMDGVENRLEKVEENLSTIINILNQARGGWRVILGFCAVVGAGWGMIEFILKK